MDNQKATSTDNKDHSVSYADERVSFLLQPDTLLSDQYFDNFRRKTHLEPEKQLLLAVLEDGINTFRDNVFAQGEKNKRLFKEAEEWITATEDDGVFSFVMICDTLGINAEYVRRGLLRWKQKKIVEHSRVKDWERKKLAG